MSDGGRLSQSMRAKFENGDERPQWEDKLFTRVNSRFPSGVLLPDFQTLWTYEMLKPA